MSETTKLPVRYDYVTECLVFGDRTFIPVEIDGDSKESREIGEHIALCINEHDELIAEVERLKTENERLRTARRSTDFWSACFGGVSLAKRTPEEKTND